MALKYSMTSRQFSSFMVSFNKKFPLLAKGASEEITKEFQKEVYDRMRRRAPRWSGNLRDSIEKGKPHRRGEIFYAPIIVGAPYALAQELGYTPHWIGRQWDTNINLGYYRKVGRWMNDMEIPGGGMIVMGYKPYIRPSILSTMRMFPRKYNQKVYASFVKSVKESYTSSVGSRGRSLRI